MQMIEQAGKGVLLYLRQEGRGIGLANKLHAYALQEKGLDTVEANVQLGLPVDKRDYGIGSQILRDLGLREAADHDQQPEEDLRHRGVRAAASSKKCRSGSTPGEHNQQYLETKKAKLGHKL